MKKFCCLLLSVALVSFSNFLTCAKTDINPKQNDISSFVTNNGVVTLSNSKRFTQAPLGSGKKVYADANNGNDYSGDGTSEKPYKTIEKAKSNLSAGDTVILKSGIYTEKIGAWQMRGTENEPITFTAEKDADVAVTSYNPITAEWKKYSDKIYVANIGKVSDVSHALQFKDNSFYNLIEARWPNADPDYILDMPRAIAGEGTDNYKLCSKELPEGNWTGAHVYMWTGQPWEQYVAYSREIKNYKSGESLEFIKRIPDDSDTSSTYTPLSGDWFYLTNSFAGLDAEREYYYNNETGDFYIITDDGEAPDKNEIWIETRDYAVEFYDCSYINFYNINFVGGGVKICETDHCNFTNANVYFADWFRESDGYGTMADSYNNNFIRGNYNSWTNSEIAYTMSSGLLLAGNYNRVENCVIHDVNITGGYNSAVTINPNLKGTVIRKNSMYRSGRFLIYFAYDLRNDGYEDTLIEYNDLYDAMYLTQDGGLIYAYNRNGNGVTIRNNWVHSTDKLGSRGIYIDNNCYNFKIYRNCVWDIQEAGLVLNTQSENNEIYNNTILNCPVGIQVWPKNSDSSMKNTKIINNIISGTHDLIEGDLAPIVESNLFSQNPLIDSLLVPYKDAEKIIDNGKVISGISDEFEGAAPDIGAYESEGGYWIPGADYNFLFVPGDVNSDGEVNILDLLYLKLYIINKSENINLKASDIMQDDIIDLKDVLLLKKYLAKWPIALNG